MPDTPPPNAAYTVSENTGALRGRVLSSIVGVFVALALAVGAAYGTWAIYRAAGISVPLFILGTVALMLLVATAWLGLSSWRAYHRRRERARRLRENADRPWIVRADWREGRAEASGGDDATFHLDTMPGVLGQILEGRVVAREMDVSDSTEPLRVTLSCVYTRRRGEPNATSWREEAEVSPQPHGDGVQLPVRFSLPADAAPSTPDPEGVPRVDWVLRVHDEGWDGPIAFRVPVFGPPGADPASRGTTVGEPPQEEEIASATDRAASFTPEDNAVAARVRGVQIDASRGTLCLSFAHEVTSYQGSTGCGVALLVLLLGIHGVLGYLNVVVAAPLALHVGPHVVVGVFTLYFAYNTLRTSKMAVEVTIGHGRLEAAVTGLQRHVLVDTPCANVARVEAVIEDPQRPERGHAIRLHCRERISQGGVADAVSAVGATIGAFGRHTGDADPRERPTLPVRFPEKEDAEAIAARIETDIQDCAAKESAA